ncbi:MAG TPA: NADH:ubiquinone reductase (Na(+)-transporting) subunit E [Firmicutes bacterium]|jgi:Na+-transporting NADH:ubiquinone oxidoreductase subunit E|nr:NADH:ubiquinone reductase (Na(+)-transporting) subunit E [Bacillota bacterium]
MGSAPAISPVVIFLASIFSSNMVLSNFLGMCSFISVSSEYKTASGLGKAVALVMVFTTVINWLIYHYVMIPLGLDYLRYLIFIIVIAATVQIIEMVMDRYLSDLHMKLGIFLPLITVNCAILGISLFMVIRSYGFVQTLLFGFGSGLGWWLAIAALAAIREKMAGNQLPRGLEGPAITFIITGIMALAFVGFSGIFVVM